MKVFVPFFLLVGILLIGCSDSTTNHSVKQENETNNIESPAEFPNINFPRLLTLDTTELRIARNSIFAKYGKKFESDDLKKYFQSQPWYKENEKYSIELLSKDDKSTIELITHLEKNEYVLWKSITNIDGEGDDELFILVEKRDHSGATMYVNEKKIEIINFYFQRNEICTGESISPNWSNLVVKIIDTDKLDLLKELVITQRYPEMEDPGFENIFVTKSDGILKSFTLGSKSYNSGGFQLSKNKLILNVSNCPIHTQTYLVKNGEVKIESEFIDKEPEGGCSACFIGNSMVAMAGGTRKHISKLQVGDKIISYDTQKRYNKEATVEEIVSVYHSSLIELFFEHDTITSTLDHPYYISGKGWSSFDTLFTKANYTNYESLKAIVIGDDFIRSNGSTTKLLGINQFNEAQITYTITKLKNGDTFYVNDILVGVEDIRFKKFIN